MVSFGQVTLRPTKGQKPLEPWLVRVWEPEAPEGVEPVEWIVASSQPAENPEEALERVDRYTARWLAEEYHRCLKTGCAMERRDLEDAERIQRLLGILALVAARVLQMRKQSRLDPDAPASTVAKPLEVAVVAAKAGVQPEEMTARAFWHAVARLGGFVGRRRDGEPGWKTLWRGWQYVQTLVEGARLASFLQAQALVGKS